MAKTTDEFGKAAAGAKQSVGIDTIKKDQPPRGLDYNGPGGAQLRAAKGYESIANDKAKYDGERAAKYVKMDKGKSESLSQSFNKSASKGMGIG